MSLSQLIDLTLDEALTQHLSEDLAQEKRIAIHDILEANAFALADPRFKAVGDGKDLLYKLKLGMYEAKIVFDVTDDQDQPITTYYLSLSPLKQVLNDYYKICEAYFDAVTKLPANQIEAIDMGRRGIHNEGAEQLTERLEGKIAIDKATARRLFTLLYVMQQRKHQ